jgi:hypothetical protein
MAGAAALCLPQAAHADSTVIQSQNSTLEASATSAAPGDSVTFTLTVTNSSSRAVQGYQEFTPNSPLFDATDSSACTVISGPTPGVCVAQPPTGYLDAQWGYGSSTPIPANSTAKVSLTTTVAADTPPGTYTLTPDGKIGSATSTFSPANFTFQVTGRADLAVGLTASASPLAGAINYTQTAVNNGPTTSATSTVTTTLPTQTAGVTGLPANCAYNATAKSVACTATGLATGATATHAFTANLDLLTLGSLPATATRTTSSPIDPNPANDTVTATCTALTSLVITC